MYYVNFTAANKDYRLRLNTMNIVTLEKALGGNPLTIFGDGDRLPTTTEMVAILYNSLQPLNHGISLTDAYSIFDAYLADGHSATEFIPVIMEVYKASGIIKADNVSVNEVEEKN
jgi:hypothetical protein